MSKNFNIIIGTIFFISSGFIFTIERLISYLHWYLRIEQKVLEIPISRTNIFVWLFVAMGLIFFMLGFRRKE